MRRAEEEWQDSTGGSAGQSSVTTASQDRAVIAAPAVSRTVPMAACTDVTGGSASDRPSSNWHCTEKKVAP